MRTWLWAGIVGASVGFFGVREVRLAGVTRAQPQEISCKELAERGPGENAHVRVRDFAAAPGTYVYEERKGAWISAWIPVVPLDSDYAREVAALLEKDPEAKPPPPKDVRIVARLPNAHSAADVDRFMEAEVLTGVVINEIASLGRETRKLLESSYPSVDFDRCWILEEGRKPASMVGGIAAIAGALLAFGLAFWLYRR